MNNFETHIATTAARADSAAKAMKLASDQMMADPKSAAKMGAFNRACAEFSAAELAAKAATDSGNMND